MTHHAPDSPTSTPASGPASGPGFGPRHRLGVAVKLLGASGLPSHDSRRWQNSPHLSVSLAYLRDIFVYLQRQEIFFYRLSSQLAPYLTHPDLPDFHRQLDECTTELAATGDLARQMGLRLTMHPAFHIQLNSPDPTWAERSRREVVAAADLMERMGLGPDSVLVVHVGGGRGEQEAGRARFVNSIEALPASVRARLALENDDRIYSLTDTLWIHRRTGIRLVMDVLHHRCLDPEAIPVVEALQMALATWPAGQIPKIHLSSPRTAARHIIQNGAQRLSPPLVNQHSDFLHPFECIDLLRAVHAAGLRPFDIMLEAKAHDLALLRLRDQIALYAVDVAERMG